MIIYKATSKTSGKSYIGQTVQTLKSRWSKHVSKRSCKALGAAINKYGPDDFTVETLETCSSYEEMNKKEAEYIEKFGTISPGGYNLMSGGGNSRHNEETKVKIGEANGRRVWSTESKLKASRAKAGVCNRKSPVTQEEKELHSKKAVKQWEDGNIGEMLKRKAGIKLYVPELDMCFFCASDLALFLKKKEKHSGRAILGSCEKGYKYLKKYTIIKLNWTELQQKSHIEKCSMSQVEKLRAAAGHKVLHVDSGNIYSSIAHAASEFGLNRRSLSKAVQGNRPYKEHRFVRV